MEIQALVFPYLELKRKVLVSLFSGTFAFRTEVLQESTKIFVDRLGKKTRYNKESPIL
jgi:hypothetical protein